MLAICDADYNFTYVNVGAAGSESDGGIFRRCEFGKQVRTILNAHWNNINMCNPRCNSVHSS